MFVLSPCQELESPRGQVSRDTCASYLVRLASGQTCGRLLWLTDARRIILIVGGIIPWAGIVDYIKWRK